ncbi:MAG: S41 family peptidase [Flavobacteriales bacterium]
MAQAQVSKAELLTAEQMHEDLDSLLNTIVQSHPKPGGFADLLTLETAFAYASSAITESKTTIQFAEIVSALMLTMHDSHSGMDYAQLQQMCLDEDGFVLPFASFGNTGKIYVNYDWEEKIPRGSRLLNINGMSADSLLARAMQFACTEGNADDAQLAVAHALMPLVASLYTPADSLNHIEIENIHTGNKELVVLKGYAKKEYGKLRRQRNAMDEHKQMKLQWNENGTCAILKVETFAPDKPGVYKRFIRSAFSEIADHNCDTLILDIRNNGGGSSSWVEYLYSFIDTAGYNTPSNVIAKNSQLARQRTKVLNKGFSKFILRTFFGKNEDVASFLRVADLPIGKLDTAFFTEKTIQKKNIVYTGRCYLLINGLTASAGVDFTNAFMTKKRGLVVGRPCLGPHTGTWGNPAIYTLPQSELRVSIATIRYNYDNTFSYATEAIQPDVPVVQTPRSASAKSDAWLDAVRK